MEESVEDRSFRYCRSTEGFSVGWPVPAGHSDTDSSSFLWVPSLRLAVTGDIVYNGAYSYLAESLTPALRRKWVAAIDKVDSYHPDSVVVGHKIPGAVDEAWTLEGDERVCAVVG